MVDMDQEGNEIKFWSSEFLVKKYLHLSDADLALNKKLKEEETERLKLAGADSANDGEQSWESLRPEDRKMLLEMLAYAKKKAAVNEGEEDKDKKKKKTKKDEEQGEDTNNKKKEEE
jgi:hypothetical protein